MTRAMKDSGIEWIGEIPHGWRLEKLKYNATLNPSVYMFELNLTDEDYVSFIPMENLKCGFHTITEVAYEKVKKGYVQFEDGDILIAKVTPCFENGNLAIASGLKQGIGYGSTEIMVVRCTKILTKYLFYYFQNYKFIERGTYDMFGVAGLKRLTPSYITDSYYPIPSHFEQQSIADYLDKKCADIDTVIASKQKANDLLKEQRQIIIYEAITKGLDKNASMKDSGIEWIGEIPAGWETSKVKRFYDIVLGKMLQPNQKDDNDELLDYMCSINITWGGINTNTLKQMWFSQKEKDQYKLRSGDLLVVEGGDVGISCLWNDELEECYLQNAVHRVRNKEGYSNRHLYYWLYALKSIGYIDLICNKATIAHFTKDKFGEIPYIVCSLDEQNVIADYLDRKCAEFDQLMQANNTTIEKLKEYRQSIIYEAVTGKVEIN